MRKRAPARLKPRGFQRPKAHIFRGNRYKIVWHKPKPGKRDPKNQERWGTCSHPRARGKRIVVWPKLKDLNLLVALIDESIHACIYDLDNDTVDAMSSDIGRFLWRTGLRFQ